MTNSVLKLLLDAAFNLPIRAPSIEEPQPPNFPSASRSEAETNTASRCSFIVTLRHT